LSYSSSQDLTHHPMSLGYPILQGNQRFTTTRRSPSSSPSPVASPLFYWMQSSIPRIFSSSPTSYAPRPILPHRRQPLEARRRSHLEPELTAGDPNPSYPDEPPLAFLLTVRLKSIGSC
jgi:hypothetical protein